VILGALVLREPITWNVLAGGAAIIVSVAAILVSNRQPASGRSNEEPGLGSSTEYG
jgi:drug/metabolite transporter (DMT)-like permease